MFSLEPQMFSDVLNFVGMKPLGTSQIVTEFVFIYRQFLGRVWDIYSIFYNLRLTVTKIEWGHIMILHKYLVVLKRCYAKIVP